MVKDGYTNVNGVLIENILDIKSEPCPKCGYEAEDISKEFKDAYNMYGTMDGQENVFLGVAFFSKKYKKLVADKVFYRG